MSNRLDRLFDQLQGQRPPAPFAPAAAIRRRGRQRSHRQAVSVGVAVLAVTGLGAGGLATAIGEPSPPPATAPPATAPPATAAPTTTPAMVAPTEIPDEWLLTADDLGPGWVPAAHELFESDPPWYWGGALCPDFDTATSLERRLDLADSGWKNDELPLPGRVDQVVELFDDSAAAVANLEDVYAVVERCPVPPSPDGGAAPVVREIVDTGFAGDDSLLVRVEEYFYGENDELEPDPHLQQVAVVLVGAVVTTIIYDGDEDPREVARRAADRLP